MSRNRKPQQENTASGVDIKVDIDVAKIVSDAGVKLKADIQTAVRTAITEYTNTTGLSVSFIDIDIERMKTLGGDTTYHTNVGEVQVTSSNVV